MALPDYTVASPGQQNGAGDPRALYLKVFAGEVLAAFSVANVAMSRFETRSISSGKTAQFPAIGKTTASYHTPGTMIDGVNIKANERTISIDDMLQSSFFTADIDDALSHYESRSQYAKQAGIALATTMDQHILQIGCLAARAAATVSGGDGGSQIVSSTAGTVADDLVQACFDSAQKLDEKNVPDGDRSVFLRPAQYYLLVNSSSKLVNMDYTANTNGGVESGRVGRVAGLEIVKTNNLPITNINTGLAAYQGNFSTTVGLVAHRSAVGTVKLIDLAVESERLVTNLGYFTVAYLAVGHGILRPESAVEIITS